MKLFAALRVAVLALGLLALVESANATPCASPTGNPGDIRYASNYGVMAYCNNVGQWTSMAGGVSVTVNTSGGGGATPAGNTNDIQFNSSGALAADTGNFTYASGVLKAPTISATTLNSQYGSVTTLYNPGTFSGNTAALNSVSSSLVSASTISATYIQLPSATTILVCGSGAAGTMRYTSGTMQVCDGSGWTNVGIGIPTGTIAAFATSSCPSGWSEYTTARGRFLRGIDNGAGNDPGGTRSPGNTQSDLVGPINYTFSMNWGSTYNSGQSAVNGLTAAGSLAGNGTKLTGTVTGDNGSETRPKNVAVTFCQYQGYQSQLATGVATLASLSDVSVAGATSGSALVYNGSSWVAGTASNAQGDRITSSTFSIIANPTAYASLSTNGTTWGYFGSAASFIPQLQVNNLNAGNVSSTLVQTGASSATCGATLYGTLRWNATSDTIQVCNTGGWTSMASSSVPNTTISNGTANYGAIFSGANTLVTDTAIYVDRTNHRLGVGTNTPSTTLDVSGTAGNVMVASDGAHLYMTRPTNNYIKAQSPGGALSFGVNGNSDLSPALFLSAAGKTGINTAGPVATLDVAGTISSSDAIQVGTSSLTCATAIKGSIRYSTTSNTLEYCSGSAWLSLGPSATVVPSFWVTKGGTDQTIPLSTTTKLTWSSIVTDNNNNFSTATGRYTPTIPGKYLIILSVTCNDMASNSACYAQIVKNGNVSQGSTPVIRGSAYQITSVATAIVDFNGSTDYVEGWAYNSGTSGTILGTVLYTTFQGALLTMNGGGGGGAAPAGTSGDIQYNSGGVLAADTGQLYWDGTNHRLGLGMTSPGNTLDVSGSVRITNATTNQLTLNTSGTSHQAAIALFSNGTGKWQMGKLSDDSFFLWDTTAARNDMMVLPNGDMLLMPSGNNVGIGTTSTANTLEVSGTQRVMQYVNSAVYSAPFTVGVTNNAAGSNYSRIAMGQVTTNNMFIDAADQSNTKGNLVLQPWGGNVGVGTTDATVFPNPGVTFSPTGVVRIGNNNQSSGWGFVNMYRNGTNIGSIGQSGTTGVTYNTTSDRRVKENIANTREGLQKLMDIEVKDFNFRKDPSKTTVQGFIAQDLNKVYPEAVTTNGDDGEGPLKDTKDVWQVDYGRITPLIVKAVQDLKHLFDTDHDEVVKLKAANDNLEEEVKALKASNTALKAANDNFGWRLEALEKKAAR